MCMCVSSFLGVGCDIKYIENQLARVSGDVTHSKKCWNVISGHLLPSYFLFPSLLLLVSYALPPLPIKLVFVKNNTLKHIKAEFT